MCRYKFVWITEEVTGVEHGRIHVLSTNKDLKSANQKWLHLILLSLSVGYLDFLVDSIESMLEDLTHDIWNKEAGRSQINHTNCKHYLSHLNGKKPTFSAIWRIQYHKNLITDKKKCHGSEQLPIGAVTLRGLAITSVSLL